MSALETNLANRKHVLERLRAEIIGPDPQGIPAVISERQEMTWKDYSTPHTQPNGEEIVWQDPPTKRFGAGILFPIGATEQDAVNATEAVADEVAATDVANTAEEVVGDAGLAGEVLGEDEGEEGINLSNAFRPSALGISFLADLAEEKEGMTVEIASVGRTGQADTMVGACGFYRPVVVVVRNPDSKGPVDRKIWLRLPLFDQEGVRPTLTFPTSQLLQAGRRLSLDVPSAFPGLKIVVVCRHWRDAPSPTHRLITVSLVNTRPSAEEFFDGLCLFQAGLRVTGLCSEKWIVPYPEPAGDARQDDHLADENVNRVLYRASHTFAVGHGCSADWSHGRPSQTGSVWSDVLPVYETPATSADLYVTEPGGRRVTLRASMRRLAGLQAESDGLDDVDRLLSEYRSWIDDLDDAASGITPRDRPTASALIDQCRQCSDRIADGLALLRADNPAGTLTRAAFRLANEAMLIAQLRGQSTPRLPQRDATGDLTWDRPFQPIDPREEHPTRGFWRPFQIAFLLMSLRGIVDPTHADRKAVDLIWFPTGGGKTEAYLGLTAFTVFHNALSGVAPSGVDVLMRYTLRLLTAQQFQRAATLFCAMEHLRRRNTGALGKKPFRIGLWAGRSTTPNKRSDAVVKLQALTRNADEENPFVLLRCPWCAARFGPEADSGTRGGKGRPRARGTGAASRVHGYAREQGPSGPTVIYRCSDSKCDFGGPPGTETARLPVVVIDEDLLDSPPSLLIGTVDKFAMLAWTPAARQIFGLDDSGRHRGAPPTLIIQDELHLISGPLGSMVGAYETIIEALCVDPNGGLVQPKIVASTATISRARQQIEALYARSAVKLFPPSGLDAGDSFFARDAVDESGNPLPGRLYAGVLAPGHVSLQTSLARVFATLMQEAALLPGKAEVRDPWWTLLVFFNSIRELGGAATLFSADVREYIRVLITRCGIDYSRIRQLMHVEELTGRIRSDHIPQLLERLEIPLSEADAAPSGSAPIDACLASNIIEVGVDLPRLALMAIAGQPKTTSQYIQVSSRVGRSADRPGLVVVVYGQTKPRDRSHYESFRAYHQRLYARVEPTSVTPFSPPAVDRALHALIVALVRQLGARTREAASPDPFPLPSGHLRARIEEIISDRVEAVAPQEREAVMMKLRRRLNQWKAWMPDTYGTFSEPPENAPLMHPAGSAERAEWRGHSWPTMSSLRNVDASCEAEITTAFNLPSLTDE